MPPSVSAAGDAKGTLIRARAQLGQGNLDAAEAGAMEVARLGMTFPYNEDSPAKLLVDIEKVRKDPRAMLQASRTALGRKDFDSAERYALTAERSATMFTFSAWGDSPAKALKDIAVARQSGPAIRPAVASVPAPAAGPVTGAAEEKARGLVKKARAAMNAGNPDEARALAAEAAGLKANLGWWDDSPDKVMADLQRLQDGPKPAVASGPAPAPGLAPVTETAPQIVSASAGTPRSKADAVQMLADGRKALADGKVDEAGAIAQRCKGVAGVTWGLFEKDTPENLSRDVDRARGRRDRDEAAKLLVEGRQMLARGDHEGASKLAYRSQTLYNGYNTWDMGDRPNKLLADCQAVKARDGLAGPPPAPAAVVRQDPAPDPLPGLAPPPGTMPMPAPNVTAMTAPPAGVPTGPKPAPVPASKLRAQQLVAEAQRCQRDGKLVEAKVKADEAMRLNATFGPDETSPELAYQQIATEARRRIGDMTREADDLRHRGVGDPTTRGKLADRKLADARALAASFGQDTGPIDAQLGAAKPAAGMPAPPAIQTVGHAGTGPAHGAQLLDNARTELKRGEVATARRIAEEALTGNHGVKDQAMDLLRTIDVEEFNQKRLTAVRSFDAAESAYRRREYGQAQAM
ncbi:MAG: hypothetical protein ACRC33_01570, partial [Gemmataceae bacterium]